MLLGVLERAINLGMDVGHGYGHCSLACPSLRH